IIMINMSCTTPKIPVIYGAYPGGAFYVESDTLFWAFLDKSFNGGKVLDTIIPYKLHKFDSKNYIISSFRDEECCLKDTVLIFSDRSYDDSIEVEITNPNWDYYMWDTNFYIYPYHIKLYYDSSEYASVLTMGKLRYQTDYGCYNRETNSYKFKLPKYANCVMFEANLPSRLDNYGESGYYRIFIPQRRTNAILLNGKNLKIIAPHLSYRPFVEPFFKNAPMYLTRNHYYISISLNGSRLSDEDARELWMDICKYNESHSRSRLKHYNFCGICTPEWLNGY
ncbi:MAG: hypothetical protein K2H58_01005, partial [Paramuribaculum sp.]|nr:hypothetical protein [Paramuribaculum sp.]